MNLQDNGHPAQVLNRVGKSPIVLVCEHSSRHIPAVLENLGLSDSERLSHIAWDIGAEGLSLQMSQLLDAPLVLQRYSRLVYDCNRPPDAPAAMPQKSESTIIPGNADLDANQRQARIEQIYQPFHEGVGQLLDQRQKLDVPPVLVTIHSFTPVFLGTKRDVELGILHDKDKRLADAMLGQASDDYVTRRNQPYDASDGVAHTTNLHGEARGLLHVMLEVRNDLIADTDGQTLWAKRLCALLDRSSPPLNLYH